MAECTGAAYCFRENLSRTGQPGIRSYDFQAELEVSSGPEIGVLVRDPLPSCRHPKLKMCSVLQYFICASSVYSLAFFMPIILRQGMGFSYALAQVLTSPPYVGRPQLSCDVWSG